MSEPQDQNRIIEPVAFTRADAPAKKPLLRLNPITVGVALVFLLLAVAALYMFNARAVRFDFLPETQHINIDGGLPTYQLGERYLMQPGDYTITASQEGYQPFTADITVGDEAEQDFTFELQPLPGIIEISAIDPSGNPVVDAEVLIDQTLAGVTPVTADPVAAGLREIYIRHPRYLPVQTELDVTGKRQVQSLTVTLEPAWADVGVSSLPSGATVLVDDDEVANTPATIELLEGIHRIALSYPGYKRYESEIEVTAGEPRQLTDIVLEKSDGLLKISSDPPGAAITISGEYQGQTPLSIELQPREYQLLATRAGYENLQRNLTIKAEEDQSLSLRLKPVTGLIKLDVSPLGGTLIVDGKTRGKPNQTLELTARNHSIRVEMEGFAPFETEIVPQPGLPQQLSIVMQTHDEAKVSAIPQQIRTHLGNVLRFIVPGELKMGAGRREPGRRSNEIEKDVVLTRSYYLGEKEITNGEFKAYAPGHDSGMLGRALLSEDDRPVVNVSWEDAVRFCNWLSEQDGLAAAYEWRDGRYELTSPDTTGYRLPTEAEWAWAARYANGLTPSRFPWGDSMPPTPGSGNFADVSAENMVPYSIQGYVDNYRGPAPPGTYAANGFGLYDMAGNVSEWIHDFYAIDIHREPLTDPIGPDTGEYHVIRGSNYTHGRFSELRWTFRDYGKDARPDVGFRIARWIEDNRTE